MNDDLTQCRFGDAIFLDVTTICGVKLKPFCLGHIILLESLSNPVINPEVMEVNYSDGAAHFIVALLVCALNYEEGVQLVTDEKTFGSIIHEFCENLSKNMAAEPDWNLPAKMELFKKYMKQHLDMPFYETLSKSSGESPSGIDWKSSIFTIFKKNGYTESEILNMNLKKLFLSWASFAEAEGAIKISNKYEAETLRKFKR